MSLINLVLDTPVTQPSDLAIDELAMFDASAGRVEFAALESLLATIGHLTQLQAVAADGPISPDVAAYIATAPQLAPYANDPATLSIIAIEGLKEATTAIWARIKAAFAALLKWFKDTMSRLMNRIRGVKKEAEASKAVAQQVEALPEKEAKWEAAQKTVTPPAGIYNNTVAMKVLRELGSRSGNMVNTFQDIKRNHDLLVDIDESIFSECTPDVSDVQPESETPDKTFGSYTVYTAPTVVGIWNDLMDRLLDLDEYNVVFTSWLEGYPRRIAEKEQLITDEARQKRTLGTPEMEQYVTTRVQAELAALHKEHVILTKLTKLIASWLSMSSQTFQHMKGTVDYLDAALDATLKAEDVPTAIPKNG